MKVGISYNYLGLKLNQNHTVLWHSTHFISSFNLENYCVDNNSLRKKILIQENIQLFADLFNKKLEKDRFIILRKINQGNIFLVFLNIEDFKTRLV